MTGRRLSLPVILTADHPGRNPRSATLADGAALDQAAAITSPWFSGSISARCSAAMAAA
ncbi:hypothetical protein D3C78_516010 [compost metagenome]